MVAEHGTRLTELDGVGPVVAARLLGRTGHAGRFASASAFANYAGVAPVEVASAPTRPAIACLAAGTASSTSRCTSSR